MFRARALTAERTRSTVMVNGAMWPLKSNGLKTGSFLGLDNVTMVSMAGSKNGKMTFGL